MLLSRHVNELFQRQVWPDAGMHLYSLRVLQKLRSTWVNNFPTMVEMKCSFTGIILSFRFSIH